MGSITSFSSPRPLEAGGLPVAPRGEITVADILSSSAVYQPGSCDRYFHHQWAAILITRGGYRVGVDAPRRFDAEAGDVLLMSPETDHAWTTVGHPRGEREGFSASFVLFRPPSRLAALLDYQEIAPHYRRLRVGFGPTWRRVVRCFRQMQSIFESRLAHRAELQLNLLEQSLLWCASLEHAVRERQDARVRSVIEYMAANLATTITIEQLCRAGAVSRSHLAVVFERETGFSPMRYLEKLRLELAQQRLQMTTQRIEDIATAAGFCDAKHFAKRFRAVVGTTPSAFRREANATARSGGDDGREQTLS